MRIQITGTYNDEYFLGPLTRAPVVDGSPPQVVEMYSAEGQVRLTFGSPEGWSLFLGEMDRQIQFEKDETTPPQYERTRDLLARSLRVGPGPIGFEVLGRAFQAAVYPQQDQKAIRLYELAKHVLRRRHRKRRRQEEKELLKHPYDR